MPLHYEVLNKEQKELLPKLAFLKDQGFYLAGGTALALQIGHRTSIDFDFYSKNEFDNKLLSFYIAKKILNSNEAFSANNTLKIKVGHLEVSFFYYPYDLIQPPIESDILLADKKDIAAMKLLAIADRGTRRDFIDLYFLIREFGLAKLFEFLQEKYPRYDPYHSFLALTYFVDADQEGEFQRFTLLKTAPEWDKMKKFFIQTAFNFKKQFLKP
ncbi:MAG: nucleotidyl transferase AbiEii/AbiGii toxin family protein [Candidatus Aenigmatarchaeota archaeon]